MLTLNFPKSDLANIAFANLKTNNVFSFNRFVTFSVLTNLAVFCSLASAEDLPKNDALKTDLKLNVAVTVPVELPAPALSSLTVPANFQISRIAEGLGNTRILSVTPDGKIYVTRREEGDIKMLSLDANGRATGEPITVARRSGLHGLDFYKGKAYMVSAHEVFVADVKNDGTFGPLKMIIHDLPAAGQHNNRTIKVGPDAMLYISVGSTCNICNESSPENATLLRASLDGKRRAIFASGLRNTIGFGWHPVTGQLWGMDHGIDWHGDNVMPEELNLIEKGQRFGWPYLYANNQEVPRLETVGKITRAEWKLNSQPNTLGYTSHAAPMQMAFYSHSQFPAEFKGDAFVAMRGSWNRSQPSGYEIVHVDYQDGKPTAIKPFVTGFLSAQGSSGRPVGLAIMPDGSLIFSEDQNGSIYRVSYNNIANKTDQTNQVNQAIQRTDNRTGQLTADNSGIQPQSPPATEMNKQVARGSNVPIAMKRDETAILLENQKAKETSIKVTTPAFKNNEKIPEIYSGYDQDTNFQLNWSQGNAQTKSYVLIMEDPDSKNPPVPVVHWIMWNIPANITSLPEGIKKQDRLLDPNGIRQGPTSTGKIGYMGPKPPENDAVHRYHTQIFALDQELDLPAGTDRDQLLTAMKGHVIAKGELIGQFIRPDKPKKP